MSVYYCLENNWDKIEEYWENTMPEDAKDESVFQMESFPKEGLKSITFISHIDEIVQQVDELFGLKINNSWTSVGQYGLKRLTGVNSKWYSIALKNEDDH